MKRIIVDLDNTITNDSSSINYRDKTYDSELVERLNQYRALGYEIIIFTARNMETYKGDISKININTLPLIIDWLSEINLNYDGILVGKPWCGEDGFYIDDKAIRPSEFKTLSSEEIYKLLDNEKK